MEDYMLGNKYQSKLNSITQPFPPNGPTPQIDRMKQGLFSGHTYDYANSMPGLAIHWKAKRQSSHLKYGNYVVNLDEISDLNEGEIIHLQNFIDGLFSFKEVTEFVTYMWKKHALAVVPMLVPTPLDVGVYAKGKLIGMIETRSDSFAGGLRDINLQLEDDEYPLSFGVVGYEEAGCHIDKIVAYSMRLKIK